MMRDMRSIGCGLSPGRESAAESSPACSDDRRRELLAAERYERRRVMQAAVGVAGESGGQEMEWG